MGIKGLEGVQVAFSVAAATVVRADTGELGKVLIMSDEQGKHLALAPMTQDIILRLIHDLTCYSSTDDATRN